MKGFAESQSVGEVALGILLGKAERRPHEGVGWSDGVEGGGTRIPLWGREQRKPWERAGKGERCHRDAHRQGRCRRDPRKGLGGRKGCHRDPHTLGRCRPHKWVECRGELSTGTPQSGKVQKGPHEGSGCWEGW